MSTRTAPAASGAVAAPFAEQLAAVTKLVETGPAGPCTGSCAGVGTSLPIPSDAGRESWLPLACPPNLLLHS
jgi:hypothetical protein